MNKNSAFARRLAFISATTALAVGSAHAELPAAVATSITAAQTDMTTAIGLIIGAMVVVWGLRKLGQKLGWL